MNPFLIAVAGSSCSGKTELAQALARELHAMHPLVIPLDAYYNDLSGLTEVERLKHNFDSPESLDAPLLFEQINRLASGLPVERPIYDYASHRRCAETILLEPKGCVIIEGLFSLHWEDLRRLCAFKIFIEIDDAAAFARRLGRDNLHRGASEAFTRWQWEHHVLPMARQFILPTRRYADLVLSGSKEPPVLHRETLDRLRELRFFEDRLHRDPVEIRMSGA